MGLKRRTNHFQGTELEDEVSFHSELFSSGNWARSPPFHSFLPFFKLNEFVLCPPDPLFFSPCLIDLCTSEGVFPMAMELSAENVNALYKLHQCRSVVFLDIMVLEGKLKKLNPVPNIEYRKISVKKKLVERINEKLRTPALSVFINRQKDIADVFFLFYQQHGEMWCCSHLRKSFVYMFTHHEDYKTKIIITAIRRVSYGSPCASNENEINEGQLAACEIGFLVGDIYTSATGAYCANGCGLLQLRITGEIMKEAGCKVWDLGMRLEYKERHLNTQEVERDDWVNLVKDRVQKASAESIREKIVNKYQTGQSVGSIITSKV